jgi:hypothetical protein
MSEVSGRPTGLHCHHCGREVAETTHTRSSHRVDYYALHTGDVEPTTIRRGDVTVVTAFKLLTRHDVVTCVNCYRQPRIREEREALFRPELSRVVDEGVAT